MQKFEIDKKDFNPTHTLECGQFFRFKKEGDSYFATSKNWRAKITENKNGYLVQSNNSNYFKEFFATNENYNKKKKELGSFNFLQKPIEFGYGIRILKQDLFEAIICFIISQNNNIKRIQKIIEAICKSAGKKQKDEFGEFYAFPTQNQLLQLTEDDYKKLGLGYRAAYLAKVVPSLTDDFLQKLTQMSTPNAREALIALPGIGRKVADCILLFGLGRGEVFPVDVWCERVYLSFFKSHAQKNPKTAKSREKISDYLSGVFGNNAGIAQQYLFYYMRSN